MPISGTFEEEIDSFIDDRLELVSPAKRPLARFILKQTKLNVLNLLSGVLNGESIGIGNLSQVCSFLDGHSLTYAPESLGRAELSGLEREILELRLSIKWQIISERLKNILPKDDSSFTYRTIERLDPELLKVIREALREGKVIQWAKFSSLLPNDLAERYAVTDLSADEHRQVIEEKTKRRIEALGLSDVVAGLSGDPKKLAYFLDLAGLDLTERDKSRIIYLSFSGLKQASREPKIERLLREYTPTLERLKIAEPFPEETDEKHITIQVEVPPEASYLLVRGPWNRDIKVGDTTIISFDVVLTPGERNEISLMAYNDEQCTRSAVETVVVIQTGDPVDEDTLVEFLKAIGEAKLDSIKKNTEQLALFRRCIEESLIKRFAGSFEKGEQYVRSLITTHNNSIVGKIMEEILVLFREIYETEFSFIREGESLMFFQKYCVYKILIIRQEGGKAVILANEPGLGKTITALAATAEDEVLVVAPNLAASTWIEQGAKFFDHPFQASIAGKSFFERMKALRKTRKPCIVTNIEFVRDRRARDPKAAQRDDEKFELLNLRRNTVKRKVVVVDEAHVLKNDSQQTEGVTRLESDFGLYLSASPFRDARSFCKVMARIYPEDPRFTSLSAFVVAFPPNDPQALKTLYVMAQPHVIRFLKSDVLPTYDSSKPLEGQAISLPKKVHIDPFNTGIGAFVLCPDQEEAILKMFQDWASWTVTYDRYMPTGREAVEDGIRAEGNLLTKGHALRQIVNNPEYIGSNSKSPKHEAAMRILEKEIEEKNGKVVVFCRYQGQIHAYAKLLQEAGYKYALFTGKISRKKYLKDSSGKPVNYQVDEYDNYLLGTDGHPIVVTDRKTPSKPMLALDYERLVFQNDPNTKICLSTYSAGAQSVTFTAATAMIKDDLPEDVIRDYQTEDRIHRIDKERFKTEVRYYSLVSSYSDEFLKRMRAVKVEIESKDGETKVVSAFDLWFKQGTLDDVHYSNLQAQRTGFELINNGIALDPDLVEEEVPFNLE